MKHMKHKYVCTWYLHMCTFLYINTKVDTWLLDLFFKISKMKKNNEWGVKKYLSKSNFNYFYPFYTHQRYWISIALWLSKIVRHTQCPIPLWLSLHDVLVSDIADNSMGQTIPWCPWSKLSPGWLAFLHGCHTLLLPPCQSGVASISPWLPYTPPATMPVWGG